MPWEIDFNWIIALLTLTGLEIVLGIDNIVLISILSEKLPPEQRSRARRIGLGAALGGRIILLSMVSWLSQLTTPVFTAFDHAVSVRDLILIGGGLFLLFKATTEIYEFVEIKEDHGHPELSVRRITFKNVIVQILLFDVVFSLDSVLTAIGLVEQLSVMVLAVMIAIGFMILFANVVGDFVARNPSIKILALSFLVMIGVLLVAEGFGSHFNRGYVYFAMAFSLSIELLNIRRMRKTKAKILKS